MIRDELALKITKKGGGLAKNIWGEKESNKSWGSCRCRKVPKFTRQKSVKLEETSHYGKKREVRPIKGKRPRDDVINTPTKKVQKQKNHPRKNQGQRLSLKAGKKLKREGIGKRTST